MADRGRWKSSPSLRRRFAVWFGLLVATGAVLLRLGHYQTTVGMLDRDWDVQLWSRLAAVKAQERLAPDAPLDPHIRAEGVFLPDLPDGPDWAAPRILGLEVPRIEPTVEAPFAWFAGVWNHDGTLVDGVDLPPGFRFDPGWRDRVDTMWTSVDGGSRLAATGGDRGTVLVVGAPLASLQAARRRLAVHQVLTFVLWMPLILGVAWLALSRVLVPLAAIATTARRIRAGRFAERIDVTHTDTEFREVAGTLNEMLDRLDAIRLSQARFNADVAHQLLNPVHAILLECEAAERTAGTAEGAVAAITRVGDLAHRIEGICEAMLAYSRSAALEESRLRPVDLEPVVAVAVDRTADLARRRDVAIDVVSSAAVVKGDAALLEEVFVNLLANAIEHSPRGTRIEIVTHDHADGCHIDVVDHGTGVPDGSRDDLFDRFRTSRMEGGHGIGLAVSRLIARSHGGDIVHTDTPGGGATFSVRLPAGNRGMRTPHGVSLSVATIFPAR